MSIWPYHSCKAHIQRGLHTHWWNGQGKESPLKITLNLIERSIDRTLITYVSAWQVRWWSGACSAKNNPPELTICESASSTRQARGSIVIRPPLADSLCWGCWVHCEDEEPAAAQMLYSFYFFHSKLVQLIHYSMQISAGTVTYSCTRCNQEGQACIRAAASWILELVSVPCWNKCDLLSLLR